jgi:hypothetical protein
MTGGARHSPFSNVVIARSLLYVRRYPGKVPNPVGTASTFPHDRRGAGRPSYPPYLLSYVHDVHDRARRIVEKRTWAIKEENDGHSALVNRWW